MSSPPDRGSGDAASFIGNIPEHYDTGLGPMIFVDYAADIAHRTAACGPARVLETAAGTGIVTRQLRDFLPRGVHLTRRGGTHCRQQAEIAQRKLPNITSWLPGIWADKYSANGGGK